MAIELIHGNALSDMCDYSFGDQMGGADPKHIIGGFMKPANPLNYEFLEKAKEFEDRIMTLFIDNIRLYPRTLEVDEKDAYWVANLMSNNDLLSLCRSLTRNKFIIFCSHEDTPIDDQIDIPENVLGIHAVNAAFFGGKIHPFPYGLQRKIDRPEDPVDNRLEIMADYVSRDMGKSVVPTKDFYVNCGIGRHESRKPLLALENEEWATTRFDKDSMFYKYDRYSAFLDEMLDHRFMACPEGHGMDCHRNWELLYLRRVPVMIDTPYFRTLMAGFPVLFVERWEDVTKELLDASRNLLDDAQNLDHTLLDLRSVFDTITSQYEKDYNVTA